MALTRETLRVEILKRTDVMRDDFLGFPPTPLHAAVSWSKAATAYLSQIEYPPLWNLVNVEAAEQAFVAAALALADGFGRLTVDCLPAGFNAYVAPMFPLMYYMTPEAVWPYPYPYWSTTPPLVPLAWPDPDSDDYPRPTVDVNTFANLFSWLVDSWARLGSAYYCPPPPPPPPVIIPVPLPLAPWS